MNGYGSQRRFTATRFSVIQVSTRSVCQNRNLPVPRNRASRSESLPNVSGSNENRNRDRERGWSSLRRDRRSGIGGLPLHCGRVPPAAPPPAPGGQGGGHVVDRGRADPGGGGGPHP